MNVDQNTRAVIFANTPPDPSSLPFYTATAHSILRRANTHKKTSLRSHRWRFIKSEIFACVVVFVVVVVVSVVVVSMLCAFFPLSSTALRALQ